MQVVEDARAEVPPADEVKEGGENSSERRCTFMELALCLAPGLSTPAIRVLYKAAAPALQVQPSHNHHHPSCCAPPGAKQPTVSPFPDCL